MSKVLLRSFNVNISVIEQRRICTISVTIRVTILSIESSSVSFDLFALSEYGIISKETRMAWVIMTLKR